MTMHSNGFLSGPNGGSTHYAPFQETLLDATLQSIDDITNMDVEMQIPFAEQLTIIVLDTNILLEFLDTIQTFVSEAEQEQLPVLIIIPGIVIHELDSQKNRKGLSEFARRASTWLLKKVKERKSVKGQALDETCKPSGNWKTREPGKEYGMERANDGLILDCCRYFDQIRKIRTFLCSKDKLLVVDAEIHEIPTLYPNGASFCSRDIAEAAFGSEVSIRFSEPKRGGTLKVNQQQRTIQEDDDGMDVDDDSAMTMSQGQPDPRDRLHLEVIDYFGRLLLDLATRVAGPDAQRFGTVGTVSKHAPSYAQKQMMSWVPSDSLEFLNTKKPYPKSRLSRVNAFLTSPYTSCTGARKGQDWPPRQWEEVLSALGEIGDLWEDRVIQESIPVVESRVRSVWNGAGVGESQGC